MTMTSRGLRGDYAPGRADITGNRYLRNLDEKADRDLAIGHTVNSLHEDPITIIPERAGASWAVPSHVIELIRAAIDRGVL